MKKLNPCLYEIYKSIEMLYKIGACRFSSYIHIRGLYNDSIRSKPLKKKT